MKRVLFVTGIQLYPPQSGGQLRSLNLAKALSRAGYDVSIYSYTGRKPDYLAREPSAWQELSPTLREYVDRSVVNGLFQFLTYRLDLPNVWFSIPFRSLTYPKPLRAEMEKADIVVIDVPYHYPVLRFAKDKTCVLNSHNLEQHIASSGGPLMRKLVAHIENRAASLVDAILTCGEADKSFYRERGPSEQVEVPNAIDLSALPVAGSREKARHRLGLSPATRVLLFMASRYGPNLEGLEFLRRFELANRPRLEELDLTLLVVGSAAEKPFRTGRLIATGFVESTASYFQAADFALNPVIRGSGTNVKMFEYLAHRLPILSTSFGARGLDLVAGEDYIRFEREGLAEILSRLPAGARNLGERAFQKNRHLCDMDAIVRERVRPMLERITSAREDRGGARDCATRPRGSFFPA